MDIIQTSGKPVGNAQRKLVSAGSERAAVRTFRLITAVFILLLSVPGLARAQNYTFTKIDVPGATATAANGNSTVAIVGDYLDQDGNLHGFVLRKGIFTNPIDAELPGAVATSLNGINAAGDVMGSYFDSNAGTLFAFVRSKKGVFTKLDPLDLGIRSQGGFINAKGQAVGVYRDDTQKRHGFIWYKGIFTNTSINVPGDDELLGTVAIGINDIGDVVGNYVDDETENRHGFLLSKGVYTTLDVPDADLTVAQGINNAGTIVGLYMVGDQTHGFVLSKGAFTPVDVDLPGATFGTTAIFSINAKGEIVGIYSDADGQHGFLGTPTW